MSNTDSRVSARRRWGVVAALAVVLLVASVVPVGGGVPSDAGDTGVSLFDIAHVVGYAALAWTVTRALWVSHESEAVGATSHGVLLAGAVLLTVAYGVGIEMVQGVLGPRSFSVDDIALNAVGAGLGVAAGVVVRRV
jgi:VanZ family protein